ncbi:hypothetical protein Tcan_01678, partial [Toxocara canis]
MQERINLKVVMRFVLENTAYGIIARLSRRRRETQINNAFVDSVKDNKCLFVGITHPFRGKLHFSIFFLAIFNNSHYFASWRSMSLILLEKCYHPDSSASKFARLYILKLDIIAEPCRHSI